ncbi:MAG: MBL fold metallo-hydrolase [Actinomycetota bacterium]
MAEFVRISRRVFLARLGRGTMALAVLGACVPSNPDSGRPSTTTQPGSDTPSSASPSTTAATSPTSGTERAAFHRINFDFVSAYLVVRGLEAGLVDTGVAGSAGGIEAALGEVSFGWEAVGQVILTHHHPDHVGSLAEILAASPDSAVFAGAGDIPSIQSPRQVTPVADGDEVFGLTMVHTPGHTPGHMAIFDPLASVLIAGDALTGTDGGVGGPNPQFTPDMDTANLSVAKMAGLAAETIYFGHGEPVLTGGSNLLVELAAEL